MTNLLKPILQPLSTEEKECLFGIMLGDGHMRISKGSKKRALLSCLQSEEHKEYLHHLYTIFQRWCSAPPHRYQFTDKRVPGQNYARWSFSTKMSEQFYSTAKLFYQGKTKRVPQQLELLSPRGLAYWYMDDGALHWKGHGGGVRLCTEGFLPEECQRLAQFLEEKWGLRVTLHKKRRKKILYISSRSLSLFSKLITPHMHPSMLHKLPDTF